MAGEEYTVEQAEDHIGELRGQVNVMGEAHTFSDVTDPPTNPATGVIAYSLGGDLKYASSDGQDYNTGRASIGGTFLTLSTSFQTAASANLGLGTYHFRGQLLLNPTVGGGNYSYKIAASGGLAAASSFRVAWAELITSSTGTVDWVSALGTALNGTTLGGTPGDRVAIYDGWIVVTTAGTLNVQVSLSAGASTLAAVGSYLEIFPVT